jgi:hypothetical protein
MKKTILEIYALAVCFVTVMCFVIGLGVAAYNLLAIVKPDFTINSRQYTTHQTNDAFWNNGCAGRQYCSPQEKKVERPSETELTKQREESFGRILANEQRNSSQTLVQCLILILIDAAAFVLHWLLARRARATAA